MNMQPNGYAIFELKGRALKSAQMLEHEARKELSTTVVKQSGNLQDISDSWDKMYKGLFNRLEQDSPDLLNHTGLKSPSTQVFKGIQSLPRAYEELPQIFLSPEQNPRYFMYAPIDYKGDYFVPTDSKLLDNKESQMIGDLLFAGGWLGNAPIVSIKKKGVETPVDYEPLSVSELRKAFSSSPNDRVVFLGQGKSLDLINDYKDRKEQWNQALKAAAKAIENETRKNKPKILLTLPNGEDVRINASYSYALHGGGMATLTLSARREGKVDILSAGKTVDIPPSPAYKLKKNGYGEYIVNSRNDTHEGRKLAKILDSIPTTPSLADYPGLVANYSVIEDDIGRMLGINGSIPQLQELEGFSFLLYNTAPEDHSSSFNPPDAIAMPTEVYEWLSSDQGDKNMGIQPPPRPDRVKKALSTISTTSLKNRKPT